MTLSIRMSTYDAAATKKKFELIEYHLGRQYSVSFWYIRFEQRW